MGPGYGTKIFLVLWELATSRRGHRRHWATAFEGMQAKNGPLGPLSLKTQFSTTYHVKVKIPRHSKYGSASW